MSDPNPYASPSTAADAQEPSAAPVGAWRHGEYLVMHKAALLPAACAFTNETHDLVPMHLQFLGPGDRDSLRFVLTRYTAILAVPVTRAVHDFDLWMGRLQTLGTIGGIVLILVAGNYLSPNGAGAFTLGGLCLIGAVASFLTAGYGWWHRRALVLYYIDEHYVWLRGASPDYLNRLPVWPFPPE